MTPRELVDHALQLLIAHDMTAFAGLWAETGVLELPFAPPGYPQKVEGRAAVHEYLRAYPDIVDVRAVTEQVMHQSTQPDTVIVEFEVAGTVVATGRPYDMRYIAVIVVRDGEIQVYRDYWNPLAVAEAMGGVDALVAAFTGAENG
ncbi:nuclear transport factor 2 family protein [Pseudonocardia xinjiangensis]|uniref:nuclear transport factor 2 family protein n=1 Tax=Pseudonocardia xinjiangensis TaxID=75289 RepID=UPI003D9473E7